MPQCTAFAFSSLAQGVLLRWTHDAVQIEKEFPQILNIHDSLRKHVFEPNSQNKEQVKKAVKEMRGR